jgi:hypothetical protein
MPCILLSSPSLLTCMRKVGGQSLEPVHHQLLQAGQSLAQHCLAGNDAGLRRRGREGAAGW